MSTTISTDPHLDLVLERVIDVPPDRVWAAWTKPEYLKQWFTPHPWTTVDCEIDLRPGGMFRTTMRSPEGEEFPNTGCYLEIVPGRKLVWTNTMLPDYRPVKSTGDFGLTAVILIEPQGAGTKYTAIALHADEDSRKKHDTMGFYEGWGKALDQLVEVARKM